MALSGKELPAPSFRLNSDYMFANIEVPVPNWDHPKAVEDVASVTSLEISNRNPPMLKCKNVIVIPPLVIASIMTTGSTDPLKLLIGLSKSIEIYNKDSGDTTV